MASIYNISSDLKKIYEDLDNGNGIDLETGEIKPEIMKQLSISRNELEVKAVDYGYVIKAFDDEIGIIQLPPYLLSHGNLLQHAISRIRDRGLH